MKKAFTMLELVFVIVVVGIISVMIAPSFQNNSLRQAADQIVSHIRYTQHLAMMDNKFDKNESFWYRQRWQFAFSYADSRWSYMIFSDKPSLAGTYDGNPGANNTYTDVEVAQNPLDNNYLIGVKNTTFANYDTSKLTDKLDIEKTYGIVDVKMSGGTSSTVKRILFDNLGRPYRGTGASTAAHPINSPVDYLATTTIKIKICTESCVGANTTANNENELIILVEPETGYTHIQ